MAKRYCVRFRSPNGIAVRESTVLSTSPRSAVDTVCEQSVMTPLSVVKYGSWNELQAALMTQTGRCCGCEVFQISGERKNYYLLYL